MDDTVTANTVDKLSQRGCSAGSQVSQLPSAVPQQIDHAQCIQYTTGEDNYYNYCLWPYRPITSPTGKFQPVTLLLHSFEVAGLDSRAGKIVQQLQQEIGTFQTVYGIKWAEGRIGWEYYFYDYQRRKRSVSITRVLQALQPFVNSPIRVNESLPYFMFSLDFDEAVVTGERDLDVVHMYVG
ncbi:MAG: hypothetical protein MI725_17015, partial [Pirellulales bacterium]|nr:hypothetical protein [Pirellulales bacterium]